LNSEILPDKPQFDQSRQREQAINLSFISTPLRFWMLLVRQGFLWSGVMRLTGLILLIGLLWSTTGSDTLYGAEDAAGPVVPSFVRLTFDPTVVRLDGPGQIVTPLVDGQTAAGEAFDLTSQVQFESLTPQVCSIGADRRIRSVADGQGLIQVTFAGLKAEIPVTVLNSQQARTFHFDNDILPILNKFSCNNSGCHGKAEGQNGFKLSIFGFDPHADHQALTQESRGRRVNPLIPADSLLLRKASGGTPHGGGVRIVRSSEEFRTLHDWISAGMPYGSEATPRVTQITVTPHERTLVLRGHQQLRAVAKFSDGHEADVTHHARFQSNNEAVARVDELGFVIVGDVPGDVAIMAAYLGEVDIFRALVPRTEPLTVTNAVPVLNFIDQHVDAKLTKLRIQPSGLCSDADFLRRVSLDLVGTLPTAAEARAFLASQDPDRRMKLVDALLTKPEFADYWALKWSDWLRVDRQALGHDGAYRYYKWLRDSFAQNKPVDQLARELVTGQGLLADHPAGHFYKVTKDAGETASTLSQALLGVRIECAKCHHHPFDRWSQDDYAGMQAYFTGVKFKTTPRGEMLLASNAGAVRNPRTGIDIFAHPLGTALPAKAGAAGDPRTELAAWLVAPENPFFARNVANRVWAHFLGRGIVEPVDDVRLTNPPSHPELLAALAKDLSDQHYDFRHLLKTVIASRTYQLASTVTPSNVSDEQNFSRATFRRMEAEVLLDAICQTTGVSEKFDGVPAGSRAIQLWDSQVPNYFLGIFGRPMRNTACDCERVSAPNVSQVLHVLNSPEIQAKLMHEGGTVADFSRREELTDDQIVDELYLTFFSRFPDVQEKGAGCAYLAKHAQNRRPAIEDLAWSLMNTLEFVFNH
jgi:hypothetical protein